MIEHLMVDAAPRPIAPYSHATAHGPYLFVTGQMPIDPETNAYVTGTAVEQLNQVMRNLELVLKAGRSDWGRVLHARLYLTDFSHYDDVNTAYEHWFPAGKLPARTTVGVTALAGGAMVEMDLLAVRSD